MARYNFQSPGAAAGTAIAQEIMRRELLKQQMQQQMMEYAQAQEDRTLRRAQIDATTKAAQTSAENARLAREAQDREQAFRKASTIAKVGLPGQTDESTAGLLESEGFGTLVKRTPPGREFAAQDTTTGEDVYYDVPGMIEFRGGSDYQAREDTQQARADAAAAAADARAQLERERIEAANERARQERMAAADRRALSDQIAMGNLQLSREREERQRTAAAEKTAEQAATKKRALEAAQDTAQDTLNLIDRLVDVDPKTDEVTGLKFGAAQQFGFGMPDIVQSWAPGILTGDAADRRADVNQLRSRAIVGLMNEMKNQSRTGATGFGSLNKQELEILQNGATVLADPRISNEAAAEAMARMRRPLKKLLAARAPVGATGSDATDRMIDDLLKEP